MDDNKLEAKLLKIKALAERGEGGEKEAAIKMYHKLLKKYDIDEKALQKDKLSKHWFTYETDIEENLLVQIFYMVTGDPEYFRRTSRTRGTQCGCICTDFEKTEIRFYFEFYKDALNQELEAFLMAFKLKNHLFPDESARCFVPEEEEEISEMLLKAQKFAEDIDKSNPVRGLHLPIFLLIRMHWNHRYIRRSFAICIIAKKLFLKQEGMTHIKSYPPVLISRAVSVIKLIFCTIYSLQIPP